LQIAAVRMSCQTIAGASGCPLARSQITAVSRWFVIPIAFTSRGLPFAFASASANTACTRSKISTASCSTRPGAG
jgi:hypothetical protein